MSRMRTQPHRPGDLLGFSHCSASGVIVNLGTFGVPFYGLSHVAIVAHHPDTGRPVLFESLESENGPCLIQNAVVTGVQCQPIRQRIARYRGHVWSMPLAEPLNDEESERLTAKATLYIGRQYDYVGAKRSRGLTLFEKALYRAPDLTSLFCSEYVADLLMTSDRLSPCNVSRMNPNRLYRRMKGEGRFGQIVREK